MEKTKNSIDWKALLPAPKIEYRTEDDHIVLIVPKTTNKMMKRLLKYLNKENIRFLHLDELGTFVWKQMELKLTIGEIINNAISQFPDESQLEQRTVFYFQQLYKEGYIELYAPKDS
jgi:hypothetical protein